MSAKPVQPLFLNTLGVNGLNTQVKDSSLSPEWLVQADNVVLDSQGRITCRKGIKQVSETIGTASSNTKIIKSIGEFLKSNGTKEYYCGAGDTIYKYDSSTAPDSLTAFTNSSTTAQTITDGNWQWTTFNNKFYGAQENHLMLQYDGTNWYDMDEVGSYGGPAGITTFDPSCIFGGFGRLWVGGVGEDLDKLFYSDTLQGHIWNAGAAGSIDLKTVWNGDTIKAISSIQDKLVIFGEDNIVIYDNPWDPTNMVLNEVVEGVGLASRDTIALLGDDIVFLSYTGLKSLSRQTTSDGKMPLTDFSSAIRDELNRRIINTISLDEVKGEYYQKDGIYLLAFPEFDLAYVFDFKSLTQRRAPRISKFTFNNNDCPRSMFSTVEGELICGLGYADKYGSIALYENYYDVDLEDVTATYGTQTPCENAGNVWDGSVCWQTNNTPYDYTYKTPWLDFQDATRTKLLKRLFAVVEGGKGASANICWYRDYNGTNSTCKTFKFTTTGELFYWGDAASLYGAAKYAGTLGPKEYRIPMSKEAKTTQLKVTTNVTGYSSSWINITVLSKGGKIR